MYIKQTRRWALTPLAVALSFISADQVKADEPDPLNSVVVVGSRRSDVKAVESIAPVDVISNQQIRDSGATSIGQALTSLLPSFSFPQNTNGAFAQEVPPGASLRGMASDQVLVLVNGKRRHTGSTVTRQNYSAKGGVPVDISLLPIDAIERIEVLRDGASAQYGSDAIAGVINIVLRGSGDGGRLAYRFGEYGKGDGESNKISGWKGFSLPNDGFVTLSFDAGQAQPANDTNPDNRLPVGHPYRDWRFGVGKTEDQYNLLVNSEVPLSDKVTAYGFATWSHKNSDAESSYVTSTDRRNIPSVNPYGYWPITRYALEDYSATAGLLFDAGKNGRFDLSANYGRNEVESNVRDTLNASYGPTSPTSFYTGKRVNEQANVGLDWVREVPNEVFAAPVTVSAGVAYRWEKYALSAGEAGASENRWFPHPGGGFYTPLSAGITPVDAGVISRTVWGGYVDVEGKLTQKLQFGVAGRIEDYSDFGNTTNGKLSLRYDATPQVGLRGSVSSGYRAPSLVQAGYQASGVQIVQSAPGVFDAVAQRTLRADSPIAAALGGQALKPEKSKNVTLGLVLRPLQDLSVTVDAYQIEVDDRITASDNLTGANVVTALTAAGYPGVNSATFFTNVLDTRTRGIETVGRYKLDLGGGRLDLTAGYAYNETKVTGQRSVGNFASSAIAGRQAIGVLEDTIPNHKFVWSARYKKGPFEATLNQRRYGEYTTRATTAADDQTFSSQWITDVDFGYWLSSTVRLGVGAQNLFDSHPDKLRTTGTGPYGIAKYGTSSPEGHQGAFYYANASVNF